MKICVIGLGLIGASLAYALKGFYDADVTGSDKDESVRKKAEINGIKTFKTAAEACKDADITIICTYPDTIISIVGEISPYLKDGSLLTEVCGVKMDLSESIRKILKEEVDYIAVHPMAGKEIEGIDQADAKLFFNTSFIISTVGAAKQKNIDIIKEMASHIGATRIVIDDIKTHDEVIAYTSDLMHVAAAALCLDYNPNMKMAYTAGAFRDCTRIAMINPELWSELLLKNRENVLVEIDRFSDSLKKIHNALYENDKQQLYELLQTVRENKKEMLKR